MRLIFLGDVHIGARGDSPAFLSLHLEFFEAQLFPYMEKEGITTIIQVGDIFDRRKGINYETLYEWKRRFFDVLRDRGYIMHIILGNHDVAFKNTNRVNSPTLLLKEYNNLVIHTEPNDQEFDGVKFFMVPWINQENLEGTLQAAKDTKANLAIMHAEFKGFEMDKGNLAKAGMDASIFSTFDTIYSGHYHHPSKKDNVVYIGTPYQITMADVNSPKGFGVFDTEKLELQMVSNEDHIFVQLFYTDSDKEAVEKTFSQTMPKPGRFVKVYNTGKSDPVMFDKFIAKVEDTGPADLEIIEWNPDLVKTEDIDDIQLDKTDDMFYAQVKLADVPYADELMELAKTLYVEAISADELC